MGTTVLAPYRGTCRRHIDLCRVAGASCPACLR
ncbi:MAG TPA: putative leader peptide [Actinomycetales bacterium]|nr:putative leader peptide [Actinomycetales bacterium]